MPKTRFLTWYRLIPLAAVFAFGLISFVYSYAPAAFFKPLYPIDYEAYVKQSSISHNLDPYLVCAVIKSESNWDPGSTDSAIAAYNAGMGNVDGWAQQSTSLHNAITFPETQAYLIRVNNAWARYKTLYPDRFV